MSACASVVAAWILASSLVARADERPPLAPAVLAPVPSSDGRTATIAGAVLLGVSATLVLGSIPLWTRGLGPIGAGFGAGLDIIGVGTLIPGAILLPVGLVQASRYRRWYRQSSAQGVQLSPSASVTPAGMNVGMQMRF